MQLIIAIPLFQSIGTEAKQLINKSQPQSFSHHQQARELRTLITLIDLLNCHIEKNINYEWINKINCHCLDTLINIEPSSLDDEIANLFRQAITITHLIKLSLNTPNNTPDNLNRNIDRLLNRHEMEPIWHRALTEYKKDLAQCIGMFKAKRSHHCYLRTNPLQSLQLAKDLLDMEIQRYEARTVSDLQTPVVGIFLVPTTVARITIMNRLSDKTGHLERLRSLLTQLVETPHDRKTILQTEQAIRNMTNSLQKVNSKYRTLVTKIISQAFHYFLKNSHEIEVESEASSSITEAML